MASKKILCPYCFEEFDNSEAWYQCESEERNSDGEYRCRRVTSDGYDKYWHGEDLPMRYVWPQKSGFLSRFSGPKLDAKKCPQCGYNSRRFVCPHCFNWLPTEMIENGAEIISVIGSPSSGKTNYIVSLIHQLRKYGYKLNLQVIPTQVYRDGHKEESTQNLYKKLDTQLFTDKTVLQKTSDKKTDIPWIFHLSQPSTGKSIYLVFYDTAGEKFQQDISNKAMYMKKSSGVIIILDTLSIDYVQDILKEKGLQGLGGVSANYEDIQTALHNFKTESGTSIEDKPYAFVFSKFDAIIDNKADLGFDAEAFVVGNKKKDSSFIKTGTLDLDNIDDTSEAIEENLYGQWELGTLADYAHNWSAKKGVYDPNNPNNKYKFFGVSAFGAMPDESGTLEKVEPYRVMDPLIWLLHKLGQFDIPTTKK